VSPLALSRYRLVLRIQNTFGFPSETLGFIYEA